MCSPARWPHRPNPNQVGPLPGLLPCAHVRLHARVGSSSRVRRENRCHHRNGEGNGGEDDGEEKHCVRLGDEGAASREVGMLHHSQ